MTERILEELLFDPGTQDKFIGIRVRSANGKRMGELVATGDDAEEVFAALRRDQMENPGGEYLFYKPGDPRDLTKRQGLMISQNREDLI